MRNHLRVSLLLLALLSLPACERSLNPYDVPSPIRSQFNTSYSRAEDVTWTVEEDYYVARFRMDGRDSLQRYTVRGGVRVFLPK